MRNMYFFSYFVKPSDCMERNLAFDSAVLPDGILHPWQGWRGSQASGDSAPLTRTVSGQPAPTLSAPQM